METRLCGSKKLNALAANLVLKLFSRLAVTFVSVINHASIDNLDMNRRVLLYEEYDGSPYGNQRYIHSLIHRFQDDESGVDIQLVVPHQPSVFDTEFPVANAISLNNIAWWRRLFALRKLVRSECPDVIQCHNDRSLLTALPAAILNRVPILWYIKGCGRWLLTDLLCFLFADTIISNAPADLVIKNRFLRRWFSKKIQLEPNAIPLEEFSKIPLPRSRQKLMPSQECRSNRAIKVLMMSYITPAKGVDTMIKAMCLLEELGEPVSLKIAGCPPAGCDSFASDLRAITDAFQRVSVEWINWTDDVTSLLADCDLVALPSRAEGVSQAIRQGMAAGRPIVASDAGGTRFLVDDNSGFVVPIGDAQALADRVKWFIDQPEAIQTMGSHARERVLKMYDLERHTHQMRDHWNSVAKSDRRLPNCVVIGPQKAGNSWIDEYLRTRDDVGVSEGVTELYFFDSQYERGLDWYAKHFKKTTCDRIVEVAPTYFDDENAPRRIHQDLGDVPIVCTVRHPAKRAFSLYLHLRRYGLTNAQTFREAVEQESCIDASSQYATQLKRWIDVFGKDRVCVLFMETLVADCDAYVRQLCEHIDIPFYGVAPELNRPVNEAALPIDGRIARAALRVTSTMRYFGLYRLIALLRPLGLKELFFGNPKTAKLPKISDDEMAWYSLRMESEIAELESMLQVDLSHWKSPAVSNAA